MSWSKILYDIPKNVKFLLPNSFAKQYKYVLLSCRKSRWFSFTCCHFSVHCFDALLFPYIFCFYSCSPHPLYRGILFRPSGYCVALFNYFIWCWFDAFCCFSISTCETWRELGDSSQSFSSDTLQGISSEWSGVRYRQNEVEILMKWVLYHQTSLHVKRLQLL